MTDRADWRRQIKQTAENFRFLLNVGNGSHIEREGNCATEVYHMPTGNLAEAMKLIKQAERLALTHVVE